MRSRFYIGGMILAAVFGWVSWVLVLLRLSPFLTGVLAVILFYTSLLVALSTTLALLIHTFRAWTCHEPETRPYLNIALRQGVLLGGAVTAGLLFQRLRVLTWWDALLLLLIVILIEFYAMVRE